MALPPKAASSGEAGRGCAMAMSSCASPGVGWPSALAASAIACFFALINFQISTLKNRPVVAAASGELTAADDEEEEDI